MIGQSEFLMHMGRVAGSASRPGYAPCRSTAPSRGTASSRNRALCPGCASVRTQADCSDGARGRGQPLGARLTRVLTPRPTLAQAMAHRTVRPTSVRCSKPTASRPSNPSTPHRETPAVVSSAQTGCHGPPIVIPSGPPSAMPRHADVISPDRPPR